MRGKSRQRASAFKADVPWDILTRIERAPDSAAVKLRLGEIAARFGFSSIFAGWVPSPEPHLEADAVASQVVVSTMPDPWHTRYFERGYVFRDPIVQRLHADHTPFTWNDAYQTCQEPDDVKVIKGESSEFGLREGFVVPIALLGGLRMAFSFGAPSFDAEPEALTTLAFVTNVAAARLMDLAAPLSVGPKGALPPLTGRERDCLSWSAEGKTDWEIGVILGIAVPTVRKHLASARDKLDALNKYHAISIGFRTGLIK